MLGKYAKIINDPIDPVLNGFAGRIIGLKDYNGRTFYIIAAENYGPRMHGAHGALAWKRDDVRSVEKRNLELIGD